MLLNSTAVTERKKINANIFTNVDKTVIEGKLQPDMVLIKCFYYEVEMSVSEAGILQPVYKMGQSDGGKPVANIEDYPFQDRGVVINVGEKAEYLGYQVGDIVWISNRFGKSHSFFDAREEPSVEDKGYKLVPVAAIELKEPKKYEFNLD